MTVANLRSAFALDRLYRLSAQAGDGDYKSQIKARFGFILDITRKPAKNSIY